MNETDMKQRNKLVTIWLTLVMLANVVTMGYYFISLFSVSGANIILSFGFHAIGSILSVIACVMLFRWKKYGFYLLAVITLFVSTADLFLIHNGLLIFSSSIIALFICFGILYIKKNGVSVWKNSENGFDYKHFRHIYQLSTALILVILTVGGVRYMTVVDSQPLNNRNYSTLSIKDGVTYNLDHPAIRMKQITKIEEELNDLPTDSIKQVKDRIIALKHILLNCIMPDVHKDRSLENAYLIYMDDLSDEQKGILEWYFNQDKRARKLWEECEGVESLTDFKGAVLEIMNRYDIKEIN